MSVSGVYILCHRVSSKRSESHRRARWLRMWQRRNRWTSGVETTAGPFGQGVATSVGMAIAGRCMAQYCNRPGFEMCNYDVYALCGDGCMMEGISGEAASLAGHLQMQLPEGWDTHLPIFPTDAKGLAGRDSSGQVLNALARHGRNKVTIMPSPGIRSLGAWLEQLLAESTGKDGKGLIPVDQERLGPPEVYGQDRLFAYVRLESVPDAAQDAAVQALEEAG